MLYKVKVTLTSLGAGHFSVVCGVLGLAAWELPVASLGWLPFALLLDLGSDTPLSLPP